MRREKWQSISAEQQFGHVLGLTPKSCTERIRAANMSLQGIKMGNYLLSQLRATCARETPVDSRASLSGVHTRNLQK